MIITNSGQRAVPGDRIVGARTWIAKACRDCNGTGLAGSYFLAYRCRTCLGSKVTWEIVNETAMNKTLTPGEQRVES